MIRTLVVMNRQNLTRYVAAKQYSSLTRASQALRLTASRSIRIDRVLKSGKRRVVYAAPGTPPHSRFGALKYAIRYFVDPAGRYSVIGPEYRDVGPSGKAHEIGGLFRGRRYPKRQFMKPALMKILPRMNSFWAYTVET